MEVLTDTQTITFKAIATFTKELANLFQSKQKSLALYNRLLNKTTLNHVSSILKHIEAFKNFCVENRKPIEEKKWEQLTLKHITYTDRIYINMNQIFKMCDDETRSIIWRHILTISALVDPTSKAKQILSNVIGGENKEETAENNFLTNIMSKVEGCIDPSTNPMEAVGSVFSSGLFTELLGSMSSGVESGQLDMRRLMGTVNTLVSNLNQMTSQMGEEEEPKMMVGQLSEMLNKVNTDLIKEDTDKKEKQ